MGLRAGPAPIRRPVPAAGSALASRSRTRSTRRRTGSPPSPRPRKDAGSRSGARGTSSADQPLHGDQRSGEIGPISLGCLGLGDRGDWRDDAGDGDARLAGPYGPRAAGGAADARHCQRGAGGAAVPSEPGLWLAAALWNCGFAIFLARLAPALTLPNPACRRPCGERRHQRCFATKQRAAAVEPDGDVGAGPGRVRRNNRDTARADFRYARWCRPDGRAWRVRRRHCRPPRSRR